MNNQDEWGPWIAHDGKCCPCVGQYVHVVHFEFQDFFGVAGLTSGESWLWITPDHYGATFTSDGHMAMPVIRYRIRKPRGLTMLEAIARDTTTPIVEVNA